MTNLERAARALQALRAWVGPSPADEANFTDLLGDLMHLARLSNTRNGPLRLELDEYKAERWDFEEELRRARSNFGAEQVHPWRVEYP